MVTGKINNFFMSFSSTDWKEKFMLLRAYAYLVLLLVFHFQLSFSDFLSFLFDVIFQILGVLEESVVFPQSSVVSPIKNASFFSPFKRIV